MHAPEALLQRIGKLQQEQAVSVHRSAYIQQKNQAVLVSSSSLVTKLKRIATVADAGANGASDIDLSPRNHLALEPTCKAKGHPPQQAMRKPFQFCQIGLRYF